MCTAGFAHSHIGCMDKPRRGADAKEYGSNTLAGHAPSNAYPYP